MSNIGTILKINLLSLLSLPLLLISIAAKLLQKALEKTLVFLAVGAAILGMLLLNQIFNNPGSFFNGLGMLIAIFILFGAIVAIIFGVLFLFGSVAAALLTGVVSVVMFVLGFIFSSSHEGYLKLYDICKTDFKALCQQDEGGKMRFGCVFWYFLKGFHKVVAAILSVAFPVSLVAAVGFAGYAVYYVNHAVSQSFGIGIVSYLKLFPTINVVFTSINFVIIILSVMVVVVSLGIEWNEWGATLKLAAQNYEGYRKLIEEKTVGFDSSANQQYIFEDGKTSQKCEQSAEVLQELFENAETLSQQVDTALNLQYSSSLAYTFTEYINLLTQINKEISSFKGKIPCNIFEQKLVPLISLAHKQAKELEKDVLSILNKNCSAMQNQQSGIDFFAGCNTQDEVHKRYKALCKIYHPDAGGHEDTFKHLQNQYEEQMQTVSVL